jgi:hypothetical protein
LDREKIKLLGHLYDAEMRYLHALQTCPITGVVDGCKEILNKFKKEATEKGISDEEVSKYAEVFWTSAAHGEIISHYMNNCLSHIRCISSKLKEGKDFADCSGMVCLYHNSFDRCSPLCENFCQATEEQISLFEHGIPIED